MTSKPEGPSGMRLFLGLGGVLFVLSAAACQLKPDLDKPAVTAPVVMRDYQNPVVLSELREHAITTILEASQSPNAEVRANAVEAAMRASARLTPVISAGLKDQNPAVRAVAAMAVGRTSLKVLTPEVEPLLADPSPFVQSSAIYGLSLCKIDVDPSPLAAMLLHDPSPRVRAQVAFVLGELGNRSAIGLLRQGAMENMPRAAPLEVRLMQLQISEALVKLGENDALQPIRAALYPARPEDLEATALAVQIIGQVKDRGAIDALIYLAATKDRTGQPVSAEISMAVAGSLARMGLTQGAFIADEYWTNPNAALRGQSALVYGEIGDRQNLGKLEAIMGDADARVRVAGAAAVLRILDKAQPAGQAG